MLETNQSRVLFKNVRVLVGTGEFPFTGEVMVQGNRIKEVARGKNRFPGSGGDHEVIDGNGATLMPGLCDAHTHFSWSNAASLEGLMMLPPEEHTLLSARTAATMIDMGYTSCVGAASAKERLDVVIRNAINNGEIPGPRYLANGPEIATLGGLGDTSPPHVMVPEMNFGYVISGPEEMRAAVRRFIKFGVDLIKLNLSGESLTGVGAEETPMAEEEIAMAVREAKARGKRVCAHARSDQSVRYCLDYGIEIIYHASFASDKTIEELAARKDEFFVAPGLAWLINTGYHAGDYGLSPEAAGEMGYHRELEQAIVTMRKMKEAGIRVLPGGDYGFAWTPHGTNAKDLEYFVDRLGYTSMESIVSATSMGGQIMGAANELGQVRSGYLADMILVDGDPATNVKVLQDKHRILAVMKDGVFHRRPPQRNGQREAPPSSYWTDRAGSFQPASTTSA